MKSALGASLKHSASKLGSAARRVTPNANVAEMRSGDGSAAQCLRTVVQHVSGIPWPQRRSGRTAAPCSRSESAVAVRNRFCQRAVCRDIAHTNAGRRAGTATSSDSAASNTCGCWKPKAVSAHCAVTDDEAGAAENAPCMSITTMRQARYAACSVEIATQLWGDLATIQIVSAQQRHIWSELLSRSVHAG